MDAIKRLEDLLARGQETAVLRFSIGGTYLKQGDAAAAIEHLLRAVQLDPHYSAAWKLLGKAQAAAGLTEAAIASYGRGIEVAESRGNVQAAREMRVFLRRLQAPSQSAVSEAGPRESELND